MDTHMAQLAIAHNAQERVLRFVQPALAGMMDGSVSTLAPLFATALATRNNHTTLLVGLAAALGAGISMAFAEALSDDGSITGRALMVASAVVILELLLISWLRFHYFKMPLLQSAIQVVVGGALVFSTGVWKCQILTLSKWRNSKRRAKSMRCNRRIISSAATRKTLSFRTR
jgi:hypothetical protein